MFELSVARKYLAPRWRQISVSIISLISILVIALVVWLIVVFFSVTRGLEKSWIGKMIALTAPVRVTPTDAYYQSYYYQVDSISGSSNYTLKTIGEKRKALKSDSFDPLVDEETPPTWPKPDLDAQGELKDPVKLAFDAIQSLQGIPGITANDFEMTTGNLRLRFWPNGNQAQISQATYLGSFDSTNTALTKAVIDLTAQDVNNLLQLSGIAAENMLEDDPDTLLKAPKDVLKSRLKALFSFAEVRKLQTPDAPWIMPAALYPETGQFKAILFFKKNRLIRALIPQHEKLPADLKDGQTSDDMQSVEAEITFRDRKPYYLSNNEQENKEIQLPKYANIAIYPSIQLEARLVPNSLEQVNKPQDTLFDVKTTIQKQELSGRIPLGSLQVNVVETSRTIPETAEYSPSWLYTRTGADGSAQMILPTDPLLGDGVLLPRPFRDAGVLVGDRGYLSYMTPTASSVQEQRMPIFVAGFYDPGIISIGGKFMIINQEATTLIQSAQNQRDTNLSNGINVRFDNLEDANKVKETLVKAFNDAGIGPYWKVETYREFEFTKDLIQQLHSEKNLFSLLATIIIIVACSNIISMLIILVNDKKTEIGILRSMGATSTSIAAIFGVCGVIMGVVGSMIGIAAAILTLKNLQGLINLLSSLQGYEMFNPAFYGEKLPAELSMEALGFVVIATGMISLIAGLVPAIKASLMRPSAILRAE